MLGRQKLLVANRGEIAVRILRSAKELGVKTVAIYSPSDALSPHVLEADEAAALPLESSQSESTAYLGASTIVSICKSRSVTMLHPGYGFLSENAEFASAVIDAGITWLGPRPEVIRLMGLKHEARALAARAGIPTVPGSDGLVTPENIVDIATRVGFPLILKATAGGGGLGMVVCKNEDELREKMPGILDRAKTLFQNDGVLIERYISPARHIEVQVFGNGLGDVVHMGERECSVQRRNQKIIEETPSPFLLSRGDIRERMCEAAVQLCRVIKYSSAGTVEFIVDEETGEFYFLEMNTRIQVEHPITEAVQPGLDLVKLMIQQAVAEQKGMGLSATSPEMNQNTFAAKGLHSVEVRIYAENPFEMFRPCPGVLQHVDLQCRDVKSLRIDGWVSTGTTITPYFDPLLCKLITTASKRPEALSTMFQVLNEIKILGPPNNVEYLAAIFQDPTFQAGMAHTKFLDTFNFTPRAFSIISAGLEATMQDFPGRTTGLGLPRSGPVDSLAFRAANILVGNDECTEGLEVIVVPGVDFEIKFHVAVVVAVTGKEVDVFIADVHCDIWSSVVVPAGGTLSVRATDRSSPGLRTYLGVRGGFPGIARYLESKSTSMGLGGYQGRSLLPGDQIALGHCSPEHEETCHTILPASRPSYAPHWQIRVLPGPHGDIEFVTEAGIGEFYATEWRVSPSSNRLGVRLESPRKIKWARKNGGEGGSHPSNILDNGYAPGSVNINGDTPIILTNEGPDMGGYVCFCTVATGDMWKLGQLSPGSTLAFQSISWDDARLLDLEINVWLDNLKGLVSQNQSLLSLSSLSSDSKLLSPSPVSDPKLHVISEPSRPRVVFRQAGVTGILIEFGSMSLDFTVRARIHAFEAAVREQARVNAIRAFCPCIRSTLCIFDASVISQSAMLDVLIAAERSLPDSVADMTFPGRRITFPIVLDDDWSKEAVQRYMKTIREQAVYLPSNVDYLARNNGFDDSSEALNKLVSSDWLVFGVGFYLACPFLVPIDPRCRLVGQKMNPSRTYTPRGAIGIAGVVAAIYPIESPGGYQLFGRTLPAWQTWGNGPNFDARRPWLLEPFDQVHFEPVDEEEYTKLEELFDAGQYRFKIEPVEFSMRDYLTFETSIAGELNEFKRRQTQAVYREEQREEQLLKTWELDRKSRKTDVKIAGDYAEGSMTIPAPIFASIWKILCCPGDEIKTGDEILIILEAMKTEIPVKVGKKHIGKTVTGLGKGIGEGTAVVPGDTLVVLK